MSLVDQMEYSERLEDESSALGEGDERAAAILKASVIGVLGNLALVVMKLAIGMLTHSVAIVGDAINNLADTLGGVLTIVGTKLSGKRPDYKHPFGYGRIEYVFTVVIGALILFSGASAFHDSIAHILEPEETSYTLAALAVLFVAMFGRFGLGMYLKKSGRAVASDTLIASGTDAILDTVVTAATIVSAIISMCFGVSTEAYLAVGISVVILWAGLKVLLRAVSKILGQRVDSKVAEHVIETVESVPGVVNACNLWLLDYGPEHVVGDLNIEVDERISLLDADRIAKTAKMRAYMDCNVRLSAVGFHPVSCSDEATLALRSQLEKIAMAYDHVLEMHSFRLNEEAKLITFEVDVDFEDIDREALADAIADDAARAFEGYHFIVTTGTHLAGSEGNVSSRRLDLALLDARLSKKPDFFQDVLE